MSAADAGVREWPVDDAHRFIPRLPHHIAESIDDHGKLLATSGYYTGVYGGP
jgi:hypothetical protein